jgi:hypothetical protein
MPSFDNTDYSIDRDSYSNMQSQKEVNKHIYIYIIF